jgi:hypothetical protein
VSKERGPVQYAVVAPVEDLLFLKGITEGFSKAQVQY